MNNLKLILGGPGCGKTTRLLDIVQQEMATGVPSTAIAFVTFTKAAAIEARTRAAAQFQLDPEHDLPWFRTIHSLAYSQLNVSQDEMMSRRDWIEFGDVVGETISGVSDAVDGWLAFSTKHIGDQLLHIYEYAMTTLRSLRDTWYMLNDAVDWYRLKRFVDALTAYKADTGKFDFIDLLHQYSDHGTPVPVQVAVIDEAQDLTAAQWAVVERAFGGAERVYVGGDDDQAIYSWAGADIQHFLTLSTDPEVLRVSHRLPRAVHALSRQVSGRIGARYAKPFGSTDRPGTIEWHQHPDGIDFGQGSWFLLARNTYMLRHIEAMLRSQGFPYNKRIGPSVLPDEVRGMQCWERLRTGKQADMSPGDARSLARLLDVPKPQLKELARYTLASFGWEARAQLPWYDALPGIPQDRREYYLSCLRRGEKLTQAPRIRLETIHGVKGAEADHVVLLTDMSHRTAESFRADPDGEHRVFYVGLTRARQSVHLVMPQSDEAYHIDS